jgi:hypothetical protein
MTTASARSADDIERTKGVAKAVLIAAVPPLMLKTAANPEGLPLEVFDAIRAGVAKDRSQFYKELAIQFYGELSRPGRVLLIPDAQYVIAQQCLFAGDLVDECARNVARVNHALRFSRVI